MRSINLCFGLILFAAVLGVYWPILSAGFVNWDDGLNIVENPHLGFTLEKLGWMFTDTDYVRRYMPIGWLSYSIDRSFFGGSALSYHLGNLLLHAANTLLLFSILRRLFTRQLIDVAPMHLSICSALGALCWAIHPLRAEPVSSASARIYCTAGLFFFLSIYFYLGQTDKQRSRCFWLAALFFGLSLFTYPIALGGIGVFVLLDFFVLGRMPLSPREWLKRENIAVLLEKCAFLAPWIVIFGVNLWSRLNHLQMERVISFAEYSFPARVMQAFWVLAWYAWKPWVPLHLAPKYSHLLSDTPYTMANILAVAGIIGLTVVLFLMRKKAPKLLLAWLCHLALLAPFIGFTEHPHHTFDRYSYIAGAVWAALIAGFLLRWTRSRPAPFFLVIAGLAAALGLLANAQTSVWNNSVNVQVAMADSIGNHPERAKHDVAAAIVLLSANRLPEAETRLRLALAAHPASAEAWGALGDVLSQEGSKEQAIAAYRKALEMKPELSAARQNLAVTFGMEGKHEEAVKELLILLRDNPSSANAHRNLAISLHHLGRIEEARAHMLEAKRLAQ
ncbi:MAG TPA: tetratricopeptide repeat protein [Candidatus Saccharimonadales bacterium]|nr:tetratricopeptide repeat protein [Candidatus Saccharimonadales bacterium]